MGTIFDIQRLSVHDGPGLRTTVFLKGCPLRCKWCHNPEGLESRVQLKYMDEKCILCGNCAAHCANHVHEILGQEHIVHFDRCRLCGDCLEACPSKALDYFGREVTAQQVMDEVKDDYLFWGNDGGITFSGGEAMLQPQFLLELLQLSKEQNYHTCVDTCGYTAWENFEKILPYTDCFLYDIKGYSEDVHIAGTSRSNRVILDNFKKIVRAGKRVCIRMPLIEEFNAIPSEIEKTACLLSEYPVEEVTLMPYHVLGHGKRRFVGMDDGQIYHAPSPEKMQQFKEIFKQHGVNVL